LRVAGFVFCVLGFGFWVENLRLGFRVRVWDFGLRVVCELRSKVYGLGLGV